MMNNTSGPVGDYLTLQGIEYRILPHKQPATSVEDAAAQRGISPAIMLKSMLLREMGGQLFLACVPGDKQVDPKKVRQHFQCRRTTCVSFHDVVTITGFRPGTLGPLLLPENIPVIFDISIRQLPQVTISSGHDLAGILLETHQLIALCQPSFSDVIRNS